MWLCLYFMTTRKICYLYNRTTEYVSICTHLGNEDIIWEECNTLISILTPENRFAGTQLSLKSLDQYKLNSITCCHLLVDDYLTLTYQFMTLRIFSLWIIDYNPQIFKTRANDQNHGFCTSSTEPFLMYWTPKKREGLVLLVVPVLFFISCSVIEWFPVNNSLFTI